MRSFKEFRDEGLLWAINKIVFHPRGYAISFTYDENTEEVIGWQILGDGTEAWSFSLDTDDSGFERFTRFMSGKNVDRGLDGKRV